MVGELRASHIIHLHRLLREVARHCEEEHGMSPDRLREYENVGIVATDFKATKPQHEEAVMELGAALGDWADERVEAETETEADAETGDEDDERERKKPVRA